MKNVFVFLVLFLFSLSNFSPAAAEILQQNPMSSRIGALKIPFIKNEGQTDIGVKYYARITAGNVFVQDDTVTYSLVEGRGPAGWTIRERLLGSKQTKVEGVKPSPTKVSIFKGSESKNWQSNIPTYDELCFGEVYDHIRLNLKAYGNSIEKIFTVEAGAAPEAIAFGIEGAKSLTINREGELEIETGIGAFKMTAPLAYQEIDGKKVKVAAAYELKTPPLRETDSKHIYGFKVGEYDKTKQLTIDPLLAWTFLGGSQEDKAYAIALDSEESVFITGTTRSSDFPTTSGAYDTTYSSNLDIFVSKFDSDLTNLLASTFIGGSQNDYATSIAIKPADNELLTWGAGAWNEDGVTWKFASSTLTHVTGNATAVTATLTGATAIGTTYKVVITGTGGGATATYTLGGVTGTTIPASGAIAITDYITATSSSASLVITPVSTCTAALTLVSVKALNVVYITGYTSSADFPIPPLPTPVYDRSYNGAMDAFVVKLDSNLGSLLSSTFLGGIGNDYGEAIAIDSTGNVFITGYTNSTNFPTTPLAYQPALARNEDAFVSKLDGNLSSLLASTLIGGSDSDYAYGLAIDGDVFITGTTASTDFPTSSSAYATSNSGQMDVFVSRLNPDLTSLVASTYLGGTDNDTANAIAVSPEGHVYVTGWTGSTAVYPAPFPTPPAPFLPPTFPTTAGAFDRSDDPSKVPVDRNVDVFVSKFNSYLSILLASTLLGGADGEEANGIAIDSSGNVFVTGWTASAGDPSATPPIPPFPTTQGAYDSTLNGAEDVFAVQFDPDLSTLLSSTVLGGESHDIAQGIALDHEVNVYIAGSTYSHDFPRPPTFIAPPLFEYSGSWDAFITKFTPDFLSEYLLSVNVGGTGSGTVTSSPTGINCGSVCAEAFNYGLKVKLTATASTNSVFDQTSWTGGCIVEDAAKPWECTATMLADVNVGVQFILKTYTIQASANAGGTISPTGAVVVSYGANQSFSITPAAGNYLADVIVDGNSVTPVPPKYGTYVYTFTKVTTDRTIQAVFQPNPVIQTTADPGGAILPVGPVTVQYGASQSFSMTPNTGFALADILVDGASVLSTPQYATYTYTFTNVIIDHTIRAVFRPNPVIQTAANAGGTISPVGPVTVQYGAGQSFSITPAAGNYLADVIVDGVSVSPAPPKYGTYTYTFTNVTSDRSIRAVFQPNPVIQTAANAGGTISPVGPVTVQYGANQSFSITPDAGNYLADVMVDGKSVTPAPPKYGTYVYPFTNVTTDRTIQAVFRPNPVIQTVADPGGTISPVGPVTVQYGASRSFSMTPNTGFALADILVDGASVLSTPQYAAYTYTFTNVIIDHTIRAVFRPNPVIQTAANAGGTISPLGPVTVQYGASQSFSITPAAGSYLADVSVDGVSVVPAPPKYGTYTYTFTNVTSDRSIRAVFQPNPVIQTAANAGGTISPVGPVIVQYLASQSFTITPAAGNYLADVIVDGVSVVPAPPKYGTYVYTFTNVSTDRTIQAVFRPNPVIQTVADPGGTISPVGPVTVQYGAGQSFSITPAAGNYLADVIVDGTSVVPAPPKYGTYPYTFSNVTTDHTIRAVFRPNPVIQTTADPGGVILPVGPVTVQYGASQSFSMTPNTGFALADILVDGVSVLSTPQYTTYTYNFTNVIIDHTIRAVFRPNPVIQTAANAGGTISPVGPVTIQYGGNQSFSITPGAGNYLADVIVDGNSISPAPPKYGTYTYTLTNVTSDRSIRAVFQPNPSIQTAVNAGGTISPVGPVAVQYGASQSFSITPDAGNYLASVIVDGNSVVPAPPKYGTYTYTFTNVTSDQTIRAVFRPNPVIQTTADPGGVILPVGPVTVQYGASQSFSMTPNTGFALADILVDGASVLSTPQYTTYTYNFTNVIIDHTIRAVFRPNPVIQTAANAGGTISPLGPVTVQYGGNQSFSITPAAGNYLADVTVDGVSVSPAPPKYGTYTYTFTNVTSNRSIRAVFQPNPVIQTAANAGGTISPVGPVTVQYGVNQSFSITPAAGNYLADVIVDGNSVTPPAPPKYGTYAYTFTNVTTDRTIQAIFQPNPVIQTTADPGGAILPVGPVTVSYGASQSFSVTPNSGYALADLLVDGVSVLAGPQYTTYVYTLTNVISDRAIRAIFRPNPVIQTTASAGGTTSPVGPVTVQYGANQSFSITPNSGFYLADVSVDGNSIAPAPPKYGTYTYTFTNVTSDRSIRASFQPNPVIQTTADTGGTIFPVGPVSVRYGEDITFSITSNSGYSVFDVIVDGISKGPITSWTFTNVTSDRSIRAVFRPSPVIQTIADTGGSIFPPGPVTVRFGGSQSFTIIPDAGYFIFDVLVNGASVGAASTYTFTNVTSDQTIRATFRHHPAIDASASGGGTISPQGTITVTYGGSQSFSITPTLGSYLADVIVDGNSVIPPPPHYGTYSYTFTNVTSDRTILAVFQSDPTVEIDQSTGGTIFPDTTLTVRYGSNLLISVVPDAGYFVADVIIDGFSVGPFAGYLLTDIREDHSVRAIFTQTIPTTPYTIIATATPGGVIRPFGIQKVKPLKSKSFTIKASKGYHISDVLVDGLSKGPIPMYSFKLAAASHTIDAVFDTKKELTVVLKGTGSGTVVSKPGGINCGKDCSQAYNTGDLVQLVPKASSGSVFTGWEGGGCKGTDTCMVTMDDDITVIATFTLK